MARLREWLSRLWATLRPSRRDADMEAELRVHLELAAEDDRRRLAEGSRGFSQAVTQSGGITQAMEAMRDQRGLPWLRDAVRDLRYGIRALRRNPFFASVAVLTLALGIGANTAIFSLADAVLFRDLPVTSPGDLIILRQHGPTGDMFPFSGPAAEGLANDGTLSGLAAFRPIADTVVTVNGEAELLLSQAVSGNYHAVMGTHAVVGRTLSSQDNEPVAVISYAYWRRRFGGDPAVIGRILQMPRGSYTVVGVTPEKFFGTQPGRYVDVTVPLAAQASTMPSTARWLYLIGRVAPGSSHERARAALRVRWAQLAAAGALPRRPSPDQVTLEIDPGGQGMSDLRRDFSAPLRILMMAVAAVLLVACANLAGLLIVRASARQQEIAIRTSLGATRARIIRQLLGEAFILAAAGGMAGTGVAYWMTNGLLAMMARGRTAVAIDVAPNTRTLAFAALVTIVTAGLFGLLPAMGASRSDVQQRLKRGAPGSGHSRFGWGRAMVAIQVALLVLLLTSAGLFTRTLHNLRSVDSGFRQDRVLLLSVATGPNYPQDKARQLYGDLYGRFAGLPGVESVSMSMDTPPAGELSMCGEIEVPGRPPDGDDVPPVCRNFVGPHFFHTMGIPILAGRDFTPDDSDRAVQSVVISESVARRFFRNVDPLGQQILGSGLPGSRVPATIVGVAKDVRYTSLRVGAPLMVYRPYRQDTGAPPNTFLIRTSLVNPDALSPNLRAETRAAAPSLPTPTVVSLADRVDGVLVEERILATLSGAVGLLGAGLTALGIYGTVAASVIRRKREIGIRMALGALPGQVARMTVREAFGIVASGLIVGVPAAIAGAIAARSSLAGVLFQLSPVDPVALFSSTLAIVVIASLAAYLPARRAARIDPVVAIRNE